MTKEEFAKKKGIKLNKATQNPSEALITTIPVLSSDTKTSNDLALKKTDEKKVTEKKPAQNIKSGGSKKKPAPSKNKSKTTIKVSQMESVKPASDKKEQTVSDQQIQPAKNKGGRPKTRTEDVKIANIAIPVSVYNDMTEYALALYNSNLTQYINNLIKKDLDENLKTYKTVSNAMKKAKGEK